MVVLDQFKSLKYQNNNNLSETLLEPPFYLQKPQFDLNKFHDCILHNCDNAYTWPNTQNFFFSSRPYNKCLLEQ